LLELRDVNTFYSESHILRGVTLRIKEGEVATLLGRNGAGKTTTVKTIMGILSPRSGKIQLDGRDLVGLKPHEIARRGLGYVPEDRRVFPSLSVLENLMLPVWGRGQLGWDLAKVYDFFPNLKARAGNKGVQLSGGEQQMLAIARILMAKMDLILLDEPTEGLAPLLIRAIGDIIREVKKSGLTILLIEQNTRFATTLADSHHILYEGKIVYAEPNSRFKQDQDTQRRYLGV
jgi:branched-chain amino acid transport system ATP-binding protein